MDSPSKIIKPEIWTFDFNKEEKLLNSETKKSQATESENGGGNQAGILASLFKGELFFHSPDREAYITYKHNGHLETLPLDSEDFTLILNQRFYNQHGKSPQGKSLRQAIDTLKGIALFEGNEHKIYVRLALHEDDIFIDLGNENWDAIQVTKSGWYIVKKYPVKFIRPHAIQPLPYPKKGGSMEELRPFLNLPDGESFKLIVAFLMACLNPLGPFPILILYGEQGSSKSTLTKIIRQLVDPVIAPIRSLPLSERDLVIGARNGWLLCFDNVSFLSPKISDSICRLSTGGGHSTRKLYSDNHEILFDGKRPIILNGITHFAVREDLRSRALIVDLPTISDKKRKDEKKFLSEIRTAQPRILGALLNAVSGALNNIDTVELDRLPRMADFLKWATASEQALGFEEGSIAKAYYSQIDQGIRDSIELDPIASAIVSLAEKGHWEGSATELMRDLNSLNTSDELQKCLPKNARALSSHLRRITPDLRHVGVEIKSDRNAKKRMIYISKK